ncbi:MULTISPECIES: class I SAM-dependent methyltransferase [unclassified Streptomyces]|uniref:class I SAM-dependent methyltransferase n=1 Tax=unclassified Streptomyces TaxID=2593676 RepID=UPI002033DFA9|nr:MULTISPECIES: class I SAM-dependent methyltransferase [unclassified Streptomyces]MCM2419648.1 class I SAM-dependent methyltransferase [Streptomyces sp. RKAG293]MCM2428156.1 class I SAM-dependent methyltransferase [Streptomyces sp. RKAG337]
MEAPTKPTEQLPTPTELAEVKGWFFPADQLLFDWLLSRQQERTEPGDLLEVGVYMGKSAIFTGSYRREGERFTVCDLFDAPAEDSDNSAEMARSYSTLTRRAFEANYLSFHEELPTVVQGLSSVVPDHVTADSCRFVHIDASHLYEHVHADITDARDLLKAHGVVVLDDFRAEHCPGVAAAAWQAVTTGGLHVICITERKLYGTWGDPAAVRAELLTWLETREDLWHEVQTVAGEQLIRINGRKAALPAQPASRHQGTIPAEAAPVAIPAPAPAAPAPAKRRRSPLRRFAVNVLPPFITKAVVSRRG